MEEATWSQPPRVLLQPFKGFAIHHSCIQTFIQLNTKHINCVLVCTYVRMCARTHTHTHLHTRIHLATMGSIIPHLGMAET